MRIKYLASARTAGGDVSARVLELVFDSGTEPLIPISTLASRRTSSGPQGRLSVSRFVEKSTNLGQEEPYAVHNCLVVRTTRRFRDEHEARCYAYNLGGWK